MISIFKKLISNIFGKFLDISVFILFKYFLKNLVSNKKSTVRYFYFKKKRKLFPSMNPELRKRVAGVYDKFCPSLSSIIIPRRRDKLKYTKLKRNIENLLKT